MGTKIVIIFDKNKLNVKKRTIFVVFETCICQIKAVPLHRQIVNKKKHIKISYRNEKDSNNLFVGIDVLECRSSECGARL